MDPVSISFCLPSFEHSLKITLCGIHVCCHLAQDSIHFQNDTI